MPDRRIRHKDEELDAKCWSATVPWAEMISGCAKSANHAWPLGNNSTGLPVELTLECTGVLYSSRDFCILGRIDSPSRQTVVRFPTLSATRFLS